ncbi:hypothetical protein LOK74_14170 [Brevibacillus humidisoli]|uniref:hypothetical protein n=1 Tax=Brevibacillus humidisoli TaxID=2895522 RepID=UPI001E3BA151|nr:hypothetical protein [Brevibacillus humidisoli]UFJ39215.1 hypothetical protein LOK74_14170 [Brevibacillus humidisoli]
MRQSILLLISLLLLITPAHAAPADKTIRIIVKTSPQSSFFSELTVRSSNKVAKQILKSKPVRWETQPELPRAYIQIGKQEFTYDELSRLYDQSGRQRLISAGVSRTLDLWVRYVEQAHFGQPLHWKDVKKKFRRMSYAFVTDLETGKQFAIQRRAGSRHADVQPLTRKDTATLKQIYEGKWSWRRRAILVSIDGQHYAASMHGMPHGAGAIADNGFPGHFCIHFLGSATHRRREPDPGHSLMILKASGRLLETVMQSSPEQLADYFLTSLHEHDRVTLEMLTNGASLPFSPEKISYARRVKDKEHSPEVNLFTAEIPLKVTFMEDGRLHKEVWSLMFSRGSLFDRWKMVQIRRL